MKIWPIGFLLASIIQFYQISPCRASVAGWLAGTTPDDAISALSAVAGMRISQLLDGLNNTSQNFLQTGTRDGNVLLVQSGNQMQLVLASARAQFGDELDNQVSKASEQLKPFLIELERFQLSLTSLQRHAVDLEDLAALDIQDLPFSQAYFGIRRVLGTVLVQNQENVYKIVLRGPHFGTAESGEILKFDLKLGGSALGNPNLGTSPDDAVFEIPAEFLKDKFQKTSLVTLPLEVSVTRDAPESVISLAKSLIGFGDSHSVIQHSFVVSLMPDYAGEIQVVTTRPTFQWKPVLDPEKQSQTVTGPYTFNYQVSNGAMVSYPKPHQQKISDDMAPKCLDYPHPSYKFPNGKVVFADDSIFTNGWNTAKYLGAKTTDWTDADHEIKAVWGFDYSTWTAKACGSINSGQHCHLPPAVLKSHAAPITVQDPVGCQTTSLADPRWQNNHTAVGVDVLHGTPGAPAQWTLTFQALSWEQGGMKDDPVVKYKVFASQPTTIDVSHPDGTASKVVFYPSVGVMKTGQLGGEISPSLKSEPPVDIGTDVRRYDYTFSYPAMQ